MTQKEMRDGSIILIDERRELRLCFKIPGDYGVPRSIPYRKFIPRESDKRPGRPLERIRKGSLIALPQYLFWELGFGLIDYYVDDRVDYSGNGYFFYSFVFRPVENRAMDNDVYAFLATLLRCVWRDIRSWDNPDGTVCVVADGKIEKCEPNSYLLVCRQKDIEKIATIVNLDSVPQIKQHFLSNTT